MLVDESKVITGILTMNDLVDALVYDFVQQLHEKREITPRNDGSFLVDASLPFTEFARYYDVEIINDNSLSKINTVGELIYNFGNKNPIPGYKFKWKNLSIEIVDIDGSRIDKLLVKK